MEQPPQMPRVKLLAKRAPDSNPVERLLNKPVESAVCTNRAWLEIDVVERVGRGFPTKYKRVFRGLISIGVLQVSLESEKKVQINPHVPIALVYVWRAN